MKPIDGLNKFISIASSHDWELAIARAKGEITIQRGFEAVVFRLQEDKKCKYMAGDVEVIYFQGGNRIGAGLGILRHKRVQSKLFSILAS